MNSFPGVNREPEPSVPTPEAQEAPQEDEAVQSEQTDSVSIVGKFLTAIQPVAFTPSGFVHRDHLNQLLGEEISDERYYFIQEYLVEYVHGVLAPVISPLVISISSYYDREQIEKLSEEEHEAKDPRIEYVSVGPNVSREDLAELLKKFFEGMPDEED